MMSTLKVSWWHTRVVGTWKEAYLYILVQNFLYVKSVWFTKNLTVVAKWITFLLIVWLLELWPLSQCWKNSLMIILRKGIYLFLNAANSTIGFSFSLRTTFIKLLDSKKIVQEVRMMHTGSPQYHTQPRLQIQVLNLSNNLLD